MANKNFKIKKGANLEPQTTTTVAAEGDLAYRDDTKTLEIHDGSTADGIVQVAKTQTLTNKTLTSPTINSPSGITKSDVGLGNVDNTSDATKNSATATLTNKTLSGNTAVNLISGSGTLVLNTTGTATVPNATDTLVGKATTDTLTNKTLTAPVINSPTGLVKADVGLGNVDNTSDATKNAASVTLTNKTLTSPIVNTGVFDIESMTEQSSTPSSPSAGTRKFYVKNDGKAYLLDSSGTEVALGSGSGGAINYVANPDAETNTTGWSTYADASGASPVDGTGGSPNVTWTRSTSSPLRGAANFLFTKDAANRQGEGVAYAFTIASADQAKVLQIACDYTVGSGTYASNDLAFYIYDVTNAVVIQPAAYNILNVTTGLPNKFIGTFQTASNSTSYRLIIHTASTSASAFTLKFDNFQVGPQIVEYGAPVSDWTAYTLVIGATTTAPTLGTTTLNQAFWRRVGDSMEIRYDLTTTAGGTSGSGTYLFPLPSGYSVDTTKLTVNTNGNNAVVGTASAYSSFGGELGGTGFAVVYNSTNLAVVNTNDLNALGFVSSSRFSIGNAVRISFDVVVPITGWASTVQMSNDTDTRVVAAKAGGDAASASSGNPIIFPTSVFDTHAGYNASTGRYTVPVPGYYRVHGYINSANTGVGLKVYKNAGAESYGAGNTDSNGEATFTYLISTVAGDILDLRPDNTLDAGASSTIHFERISGPSAVAASEKVYARYSTAAAQSIANTTLSIIDFGTKNLDSHNSATTGGSWKYTAPKPCVIRVTATIMYNTGGGWAAAEEANIQLYKNGSAYSHFGNVFQQATHSTYVPISGSDIVSMVAGDYIDVRTFQSSGGAIALIGDATYNFITIEEIGN